MPLPRAAALCFGALLAAAPGARAGEGGAMSLTLKSPAFTNGGEIPAVHTCEGKDASPALEWSGVPAGAKSLALVVDDPDAPDPKAPRMTWVHWVLYDIPADAKGLPEGAARGMGAS